MNYKNGETVKGRVTSVTPQDGQVLLTVQLKDNTALLFASEIGIEKIDITNLRQIARRYIGRVVLGKVIDTNPLTISNRQAIEEYCEANSLEIGQEFEGIVIGVSETKAKIEYNSCIITTLPQEEMGIMQASNLKMLLDYGQRLRVEVIAKDDDKIIVSHKKFWRTKANGKTA